MDIATGQMAGTAPRAMNTLQALPRTLSKATALNVGLRPTDPPSLLVLGRFFSEAGFPQDALNIPSLHSSVPRSAQHRRSPARRASTTGLDERRATPPRLVRCNGLFDGAVLLGIALLPPSEGQGDLPKNRKVFLRLYLGRKSGASKVHPRFLSLLLRARMPLHGAYGKHTPRVLQEVGRARLGCLWSPEEGHRRQCLCGGHRRGAP